MRPTLNLLFLTTFLQTSLVAEERTERFDRDPGWEGQNNRPSPPPARAIRQDFGYSNTAHAGGKAGEMGGFITAAAEPAYYACKIADKTFADPLTASGTIACTGREFHILVGFFNAGTLNEWRTPNTIALRFSGRGDVFYAWLEYATSRWRAGGDSPRGFSQPAPDTKKPQPIRFASKGAVHRWSLKYDPKGNDGKGVVTATIDDETAICNLSEGHKADGARFNRFGLLNVMKSADGGGEVWLDDITVNGDKEDFSRDPGWDGVGNRRTFTTSNVRPRFDFGYSQTRHAGGRAEGELGGLVFRGDCRYAERMACYGDRLSELTLAKPLQAGGKVSLRRGVTDSTVLIGFYHSRDSMTVTQSQANGLPPNFLGVAIEGPSRVGFYFAPTYRIGSESRIAKSEDKPPVIYPNGESHDWSLRYDPDGAEGKGRITLSLDKHAVSVDLSEASRKAGGRFDRFGLITTWIDGNGQHIYFDDLTYTWKQDGK